MKDLDPKLIVSKGFLDWVTLRGSHPSKTVLLPPGRFFRFYIINITWKELIWKILTQNWLCPKDFWIDSLYEGHIPQNLRQCFIPSPILLIFPFYIISNFFWKKSYCITALLHYCQKKAPLGISSWIVSKFAKWSRKLFKNFTYCDFP